MKKLFILLFSFMSLMVSAQKNIVLDIDSLYDNQVILLSQKWNGSKDSIRIIAVRVNGQVYGDSTSGNCNLTIEWKLDTAKAIKIVETRIAEAKKQERDKMVKDLDRFYRLNPDLKPKNGAKQNNSPPSPAAFMSEPALPPKKTKN